MNGFVLVYTSLEFNVRKICYDMNVALEYFEQSTAVTIAHGCENNRPAEK